MNNQYCNGGVSCKVWTIQVLLSVSVLELSSEETAARCVGPVGTRHDLGSWDNEE
jgi:hypothetical protein